MDSATDSKNYKDYFSHSEDKLEDTVDSTRMCSRLMGKKVSGSTNTPTVLEL